MLSFIKETVSLWKILRNESRPIAIYGMGDGAAKIMNICKQYDIEISAVFASDAYVRGHSFLHFPVLTLAQVEERYSDFVILLAFAAHTETLIGEITALSKRHTLYAPDVPVFGGGLFTPEYIEAHLEEFQKAYDLLSDETSRQVYSDIINFKISGKIAYLAHCTSTPENDMQALLHLGAEEEYLDLGAYDGDTLLQLIAVCGGYKSAIALEPDPKNFKKLLKTVEKYALTNITCHQIGSYSDKGILSFQNSGGRNSAVGEQGKLQIEVDSVDNLIQENASYIKMDVEGTEFETLMGAKETIQRCKPQLNVAAYHRNDDLFRLPLYIHSLYPQYKLYFRHHSYIPAWETILYASSR